MAKGRDLRLVGKFDTSDITAGFERVRKHAVDLDAALSKALRPALSSQEANIDALAKSVKRAGGAFEEAGASSETSAKNASIAFTGLGASISQSAEKHAVQSKRIQNSALKVAAAVRAAQIEEAKAIENKWDRANAIEEANHKYQLARIGKQHAAVEAERRRHVARLSNIQSERDKTSPASVQAVASKKPVGDPAATIKAETTEKASALEKQRILLLSLDEKIGRARAHSENVIFDRDIERLRAHGTRLLRQHKGNAEAEIRIRKWVEIQYESIQKRRDGFADTPFQTMLSQNKQFIALLSKVGLGAKQAGTAVQQFGFQVGDLAVQMASGQGFMRPFIQQATQFIQFLGPGGAIAGAALAIGGALYMAFRKGGDGVKELKERLQALTWNDYIGQQKAAQIGVQNFEGALKGASRGLDLYGVNTRIVEGRHVALNAQLEETEKYFKRIFGSLEAAKQHFEDLKGLSDVQERLNKAARIGLDTDTRSGAEKSLVMDDTEERAAIRKKYAERRAEAIKAGKAVITIDAEMNAELVAQDKVLAAQRLKTQKDFNGKRNTELVQAQDRLSTAMAENQWEALLASQKRELEQYQKGSEARKLIEQAHYRERQKFQREEEIRLLQMNEQRVTEEQNLQLRIYSAKNAGSEMLILNERHRLELEREMQKFNYELSEKEYADHLQRIKNIRLAQAAEVEQQTKSDNEKDKKDKETAAQKIKGANKDIYSSAMQLGSVFADVFKVGPLQQFLMWMQRIQIVMSSMATIQAALLTLRTANAVVNPWSMLFGFAEGGPVPTYAAGGAVRKYPMGGPLYGPRHSRGGIKIEAEGGEHIFSRKDVQRMGGPAAVERFRESLHKPAEAPVGVSREMLHRMVVEVPERASARPQPAMAKQEKPVSFHIGGDTVVIQGEISPQRARQLGRHFTEAKLQKLHQHERATRDSDFEGVTG